MKAAKGPLFSRSYEGQGPCVDGALPTSMQSEGRGEGAPVGVALLRVAVE